MAAKPAVLFVCLGNICRSPLAEAAFKAEAAKRGLELEIDSAGTGDWHEGEPPDPRACATARRHGIDIGSYRARQVNPRDFRHFSHIVALDREVLSDLKKMRPANATAELSLLLDHAPGRRGEAIPDPYYGEDADFETAWADIAQGVEALAQRMATP